MKSAGLQYLLITPARNEEVFIELTIQSVVKQTVRPVRWLIVSDGSTDSTDEIVGRYAEKHTWIELFRMPDRETRHFGGKALCFNVGYARIKHFAHDVVGSLDADITFGEDYFEFLMRKFTEDPKLGVAGTPFSEEGITYDYRYSSIEHVSGACQLFRRECLEAIGGYVQSKGGGIDVIAVISARMTGWSTRTFTERVSEHHRPMGSADQRNNFNANFKLGQRGYRLGFHPLWLVLGKHRDHKPHAAGTALFLSVFWGVSLAAVERPIGEVIQFNVRCGVCGGFDRSQVGADIEMSERPCGRHTSSASSAAPPLTRLSGKSRASCYLSVWVPRFSILQRNRFHSSIRNRRRLLRNFALRRRVSFAQYSFSAFWLSTAFPL